MKRLLIIFFAIMFGYVIGLLTDEGDMVDPNPVIVRTDTIVRIDTIMMREPVALRDSVVIKWVTKTLAVHEDRNDGDTQSSADSSSCGSGQTDEEETDDDSDTDQNAPPNQYGQVKVDLPIVQRVYGDDRYTAWVSGYEAKLDSICLYSKTTQIETELLRTKKQSRWGCVAGVGVGAGKNGVAPMIGVTIGYRIF